MPHFVYVFISSWAFQLPLFFGWWGVAIMNNAFTFVNIHVQVFCVTVHFHFSWYIPSSGVAGAYELSNSLRNCQTVFQRSRLLLHAHQPCMWAPISPHPLRSSEFSSVPLPKSPITCEHEEQPASQGLDGLTW